jgi:nucleoside-diphosphate-sugar epimerase
MRSALVTGATGGLGRALVDALLAEGYAVRATGRDGAIGAALAAAGAEFIAADLTDPTVIAPLVEDREAIFHAAALSSPWGAAEAFEAANVAPTRRLLAAAKAAGADSFVFVSTPSVYAEPRDRVGLTEASPLAARFANGYVRSKFAAEALVRAADAPGFATVALRPRALVGPHDAVLLPRLLGVARRGRFPLFRQGRALIELTDVRDAAAALVAADRGRATLGGQVFNISGGAPMSVAATLAVAFEALRLRPRFIDIPYALAAAACGCAEAVCARLPGQPEPPATVYALGTLAFSQTFDLTAAREQLGWAPRYSPQVAIERTAAAWSADASL